MSSLERAIEIATQAHEGQVDKAGNAYIGHPLRVMEMGRTVVGTTYLYALAGLAVGVMAGNWAFKRIPGKLFTYIVYAYIGISGAIILFTT